MLHLRHPVRLVQSSLAFWSFSAASAGLLAWNVKQLHYHAARDSGCQAPTFYLREALIGQLCVEQCRLWHEREAEQTCVMFVV